MKKIFNISLMIVPIVLSVCLSACSQQRLPTAQPASDMGVLGRLTVQISGIGNEVLNSTAQFTPSLSTQLTEDTSYSSSDFSSRIASTFVYDGIRYIKVFYNFPNRSNSAREITLVAVADNGTFVDDGVKTPFREIQDYDGNPITSNDVGLKLDYARDVIAVPEQLVTYVYNSYVDNLNISGLTANASRGEVILTEGFEAWNSDLTGRTIEAGEDARVVFSTSFNRINNARDPFAFKLVFLVAEK